MTMILIVIGSIDNNNWNSLVNLTIIESLIIKRLEHKYGLGCLNISDPRIYFFKVDGRERTISPFNVSNFPCFSPLRDSTVWLQLEWFPRMWCWCTRQLGKRTWVDSWSVEAYKKDDAKQILKLWNLWKDRESSLLNFASQVLFALTCCIH